MDSLRSITLVLALTIVTATPRQALAATPAVDPKASYDALRKRVAADLKQGKPLVATVYVALCDNNQIACGSSALGNGDKPRRNLYWGGAAGLRAFFDYRRRRWKRVFLDGGDGKVVLERAVYRMRIRRPSLSWRRLGVTKGFDVYLIALAYRGQHIAKAMGALIRDVSAEPKSSSTLTLKKGGVTLPLGAAGHLVGYAGHNHLMDVTSYAWPRFTRRTPLGFFALACMTAPYLGPRLARRGSPALLLTRTLMYPGAFTIEGLLRAFAGGGDQRAVFRGGADAYAHYQKRPKARIRYVFTYDARRSFAKRYGKR